MTERRNLPDRRAGDDSLRKQVRFALRAMLVCFSIFLVATAIAGWQIVEHVDDVEQERAERVESSSGIIKLGCATDNAQDRLLAKLVRVSLSGGSFGSNIDPSKLTTFQLDVLAAIAAVQAIAAQAPPTTQQRVFEAKLRELEDLIPCRELVARYEAGDPVPLPAELERDLDGTG